MYDKSDERFGSISSFGHTDYVSTFKLLENRPATTNKLNNFMHKESLETDEGIDVLT